MKFLGLSRTPSLPYQRQEQRATFFFSTAHRSLSPTKRRTPTRNRVAKRENQKKFMKQISELQPGSSIQRSNHMAGRGQLDAPRPRWSRPTQPNPPADARGDPPTDAASRGPLSLTGADAGVGRPPEPHLLDDEAGPDEGAGRHREDQALGVVRRHGPAAAPGRRRRHLAPTQTTGCRTGAAALIPSPTPPPPPPPPSPSWGVERGGGEGRKREGKGGKMKWEF